MKYVLEIVQDRERVAQDFKDQETLMLVVQALLDGDCDIECRISKYNPEIACDNEWEGTGESRHDR